MLKMSFTISPGGIVLLSLRDCHVDVSIGSAVTEPHAHCGGQGHSQQPDEENLQEKTIIDLQLIAIAVWTSERLSLAMEFQILPLKVPSDFYYKTLKT